MLSIKFSGPQRDVALAGPPYGREEAVVIGVEEGEEEEGGGREVPRVKSKDPRRCGKNQKNQ